MAGYQKPRLPLSSASRSAARLSILFRLFCSILTSTLLGFSLPLVLPQATSFDTIYLAGYTSLLLTIWTILSASNELALIVHMCLTCELTVYVTSRATEIHGQTAANYLSQCQDAWTGPTGSKKTGLALVTILDEGKVIQCRRSNLKCNGFYTCSLAPPDHLLGFERWDVELDTATRELISGPMFKFKNAEGTDIVAIATAFYRSMINQHCKAKGDSNGQFECGGHAVMRKYRTVFNFYFISFSPLIQILGKSSGKHYFIGCSNWSDGDGLSHRFTKIPPQVRESILRSLFRGEEIVEEDIEVVEGYCSAIIHPSHLPRKKECGRIHYRDSKSVIGHLEVQTCPAELLILIPVDENDLRAVVIPKAGVPQNHPAFVRTKTPFQVAKKYKKAAEITGVIGQTTLRIDKAASTRKLLDGKLPQEMHPSMVNNRKRCEINIRNSYT
ncbi:hypothetical protein B0H14DRAFT_2649327 [Mycena olivaceomarginata]|nr:hypothetical protein B0H14DRAFT_2649327 [Mycena olivaceomarginata]